ncbi:G protein-regulated inducer of neurite outgrowth 2 [Lepisosteus oculatus]|uniref:G protein-regulated inducer of neurite outgrowth 2 n=1 Tax=Lepisosteus oculatus TaxID=7918 RepID=UPI00371F9FE0
MDSSKRRLSDHCPSDCLSGSGCTWDALGPPFYPLSKSSSEVAQTPLCQEELARNKLDLRKSLSTAVCHLQMPEANYHGTSRGNWERGTQTAGERAPGNVFAAAHPQSVMETHNSQSTPREAETIGVTVNYHHCLDKEPYRAPTVTVQENHTTAPHRDLCTERLGVIKQAVQRSHSDSLHVLKESHCPGQLMACSETSFAFAGLGLCSTESPGCPSLVCKQAMQLRQNNTLTTCHTSSSNSSAQQSVRICVPSPSHTSRDSKSRHAACGDVCFGHSVTPGGSEDTFAAFCHSLPIPTPAQLLPRLVSSVSECSRQRHPAHPANLSFPRLVSSVSETGLDAKRMVHCCSLDGRDQEIAFTSGGQVQQEACRKTREMGTMTLPSELRDVGVQTGPPESPPPHVFPEVSLQEEKAAASGQKSPVKEVVWDAEGMTWDVYGASVDPEVLGLAIQKHLELQIKETASRASRLSRTDTNSTQKSSQRRKRGSVMGSLKSPACCARSTSSVD